ncbi:hypothetical protein AMTRI_Chr06g175990 [Amborella trichopoda]
MNTLSFSNTSLYSTPYFFLRTPTNSSTFSGSCITFETLSFLLQINVVSKLNFKLSTWDFQDVKFHILYNHSLSASTLYQILDFLSQKTVHLICNEIHSGAVFNPSSPFVSIAEIISKSKNTNPRGIHISYSLSKDLGVPGFRVGAICSQNDEILTTSRRMSSFSFISSQTQAILTSMLLDMKWMRRYMVKSKKRFRGRYERFVGGLGEMGIECLEGGSGLFGFVILRHFLERESWEGEMRVWEVVLNDVGLNVCHGSSFHSEEPGQESLDVALQRIRGYFMVHGMRVEVVGLMVERERDCICMNRERERLHMHVHKHAFIHMSMYVFIFVCVL